MEKAARGFGVQTQAPLDKSSRFSKIVWGRGMKRHIWKASIFQLRKTLPTDTENLPFLNTNKQIKQTNQNKKAQLISANGFFAAFNSFHLTPKLVATKVQSDSRNRPAKLSDHERRKSQKVKRIGIKKTKQNNQAAKHQASFLFNSEFDAGSEV